MPTLFVYVLAALAEIGGCFAFWAWARAVQGVRPDRWDLIGLAVCLVGAALILWVRAARGGPASPPAHRPRWSRI